MKFKHLGLALVVLALAMALGVQGTVRVAHADSQPKCIGVLASFFAPIDNAGVGLKAELENVRAIAAASGVPTGQVLSNLAHKSGDVNACLAFLFGNSNGNG